MSDEARALWVKALAEDVGGIMEYYADPAAPAEAEEIAVAKKCADWAEALARVTEARALSLARDALRELAVMAGENEKGLDFLVTIEERLLPWFEALRKMEPAHTKGARHGGCPCEIVVAGKPCGKPVPEGFSVDRYEDGVLVSGRVVYVCGDCARRIAVKTKMPEPGDTFTVEEP